MMIALRTIIQLEISYPAIDVFRFNHSIALLPRRPRFTGHALAHGPWRMGDVRRPAGALVARRASGTSAAALRERRYVGRLNLVDPKVGPTWGDLQSLPEWLRKMTASLGHRYRVTGRIFVVKKGLGKKSTSRSFAEIDPVRLTALLSFCASEGAEFKELREAFGCDAIGRL
jgi:hypothetical protein